MKRIFSSRKQIHQAILAVVTLLGITLALGVSLPAPTMKAYASPAPPYGGVGGNTTPVFDSLYSSDQAVSIINLVNGNSGPSQSVDVTTLNPSPSPSPIAPSPFPSPSPSSAPRCPPTQIRFC